jgi:hypothetical protein
MASPHSDRRSSAPRVSTRTVDRRLDELETRGFILIEASKIRIVGGQVFCCILVLLGLVALSLGPDPVVGLCAAAFIIGGIYLGIVWTKKHGGTDELVLKRDGLSSLQTGTIPWEWITGVGFRSAFRRPGYQVLVIRLSPEGVNSMLRSFGKHRSQLKFEGAITGIHRTADGGEASVSTAFPKQRQLAQLIDTLCHRYATDDMA